MPFLIPVLAVSDGPDDLAVFLDRVDQRPDPTYQLDRYIRIKHATHAWTCKLPTAEELQAIATRHPLPVTITFRATIPRKNSLDVKG